MNQPETGLDRAPHSEPKRETAKQPIFIVGPSRSGTTLLTHCLGRHPDIATLGETHYFDDLRVRMKGYERTRLLDQQIEACIEYFQALSHRWYGFGGDPTQGVLDRNELCRTAMQIGEGADAFFEAYSNIEARKSGKNRWCEKTPRHVFRIPEILQAFPQAKIICMIRDPRAVVASYRDWAKHRSAPEEMSSELREVSRKERQRVQKSYHIIIAAFLWKAAARAMVQARDEFGPQSIFMMHYRNLVADTDTWLQSLCHWLNIDYAPSMAAHLPVINSSYTTRFVGNPSESAKAVERWKQTLSPDEIGIIQMCCARLLEDFGYEREPMTAPWYKVAWAWLTLPGTVLRAMLANRGRYGLLPQYVLRRILLAFGRQSLVAAPFRTRRVD